MGLYDTYGTAQLKIGNPVMMDYRIGDTVPIADGVYVAHEAVVVVVGGKFVAEFDCLTSKWGDRITPEAMIQSLHPLTPLIAKMKVRHVGPRRKKGKE